MFQVHEYQGADGKPLRYGKLVNPERPATGKALLFVPGLGGSVKGALHFLEQLLPEYSPIYGPDLRGFGLNPLDVPLHKADIVVEDLEAFYRQVIVPENHAELMLCGISLGGVISTSLAARYPERYKALVLLAPAYRPHPQSFSLAYTLRSMMAFLLKGKHARTRLPYGVTALTRNEAILSDPQYTENPPLELNPGFLLGVRTLCNRAMADAAKLTLPTMVVVPGQDIVCDPKAMRQAFEKIPASTSKLCKEYPDFYHDVLFETGHSDIAQEILSWSASLPASSTPVPIPVVS